MVINMVGLFTVIKCAIAASIFFIEELTAQKRWLWIIFIALFARCGTTYECTMKQNPKVMYVYTKFEMRQIGKLWILSLDRFSDRKKPGWIWVIILKILSLEQKWHPLLAWTWLPASSLSQWPMSVPACPHSKFLLAATGPTPQTSGFCGYFHLIVSSRICSVHTTVSAGVTQ